MTVLIGFDGHVAPAGCAVPTYRARRHAVEAAQIRLARSGQFAFQESIVLTTRSKRKGRQQRPGTVLVTTGIKKGSKKGPEQLKKAQFRHPSMWSTQCLRAVPLQIIATTYNRPEMLAMALTKYSKIKKSFKKKVALQSVRSRK
ncbi:Rpl28 [Symbiodinium necroappetens]|uniref:Rpl28 protein n=1 Tax=Symbiodinium necroappetens TaxID=1628268 RepID=A0A812K2Q0_9DINO|nr:Rpl28 [Symbiodinium necroappetens]